MLVFSVNGIINPDFLVSGAEVDPRFEKFVDIAARLIQLHRLQWIEAGERMVLPVSLAVEGRQAGGIGFTTRSVSRLVDVLSAAIEVPEADARRGLTRSYPPLGRPGSTLRIRYATSEPEAAAVAIRDRDGWFYIDEGDQATKEYFRLLSSLWSASIADTSSGGSSAPVLTVPVSR